MTHLDCSCEVHGERDDGTGRNSVYLTFDDGPHPFCTPEILDILAEHRVPATFFVIGEFLADQSKLIQRMIAEGHEVANHTMTHPDLSDCEPDEVQRQILETNRVIKMAAPQAVVRHIRAPYGIWTEEVLKASANAELTAVHWSVDPRDWSLPGADAIVNDVLQSVRPGSIVLLHDGCPSSEMQQGTDRSLRHQTIMALSRIIPALHDRGFVFRSLTREF
ncbi:chitooligosaccharide deacetylase NodB (plasmid) [Rhizobium sp. Pop5]|uniref:chitooligosaccharide deacetylase NodB n=2 Tax=Rhizobium sp. Pop5 TaxID=1223565 RepID=UPI002157B3EF|nr:chitooligosaccharide deacetylase NodB [Rhizobium sp. Pop5]UVD54808.1 chitooligosaccharide deacetylase NodB [Rhizobium sp. Pop5]